MYYESWKHQKDFSQIFLWAGVFYQLYEQRAYWFLESRFT